MEFSFNASSQTDWRYKKNYYLNRPLKLSYSSFKNLNECPAKYCMISIFYWTPKNSNQRNFMLGSVSHTCLEKWIGKNFEAGFMQKIVFKEFEDYLKENVVVPRDKTDIPNLKGRSMDYVTRIEEVFNFYDFVSREIQNEKKWSVPLITYKNVNLTGVLDIYLPEDNKIFDLKMSKDAKFMDRDQLCYYAMMGALDGKKTTKVGFIIPLRREKVVELEFSDEDYRDMYNKVCESIGTINNSLQSGVWKCNFEKNRCFGCKVNRFCPAWRSKDMVFNCKVEETPEGKNITL